MFSVAMAIFFIIFLTLMYLSHLHLIFSKCDIIFFILSICSLFGFILSNFKTGKKNKNVDKKTKKKTIVLTAVLTFIYVAFIALSKYYYCYGIVDTEQIFYHTFVSSAGMDFSTVFAISIPSIILGAIFAVTLSFAFKAIRCADFYKTKTEKIIMRTSSIVAIISAILLLFDIFCTIPIAQFIYYQNFTESNFITEQYVNPNNVEISFPEQKRNLIYIYLESIENTFADKENGGAFKQNYMPEISELQKNNINFSNTNEIGGALPTYGMTYTTAGFFSQSFGLPLKVGENISPMPDTILPNHSNIFDVLDEAGYSQHIVMGSDVDFGGLKELFTSHGNTNIYDYRYMVDTGFIDKNYRVFWGVEDAKVYDLSKNKITEISQTGEPFFFVMETVDTHNPNGYVCNKCKEEFGEQYANVVACASHQLNAFIDWSKEQEWYDNTTIVVVGDHLSMKNDFFTGISSKYQRTTLNIIINPDPSLELSNVNFNNRQFSSADMFPTTLVAIGCQIEGDRLGLGTNLFSNKQTIFEEFGYDYVNEEFRKKTTFYKNVFEG